MSSKISVSLLLVSIILQSAVIFGQQECGDETLCSLKPANYPQEEEIDEIMKRSNMPSLPDYDSEELQRLLHEKDDEMNCSTEVRMFTPFTLRDDNRSYHVIQSKYFTQRIRDVSCRSTGESCFKGISLAKPYNATCESDKGSIQLYVLDGDEVVRMWAPYNCCCKCVIKNTL